MPCLALIADSAGAAIAADIAIDSVSTTNGGIAEVSGTHLVVVTAGQASGYAQSILAMVSVSTCVVVIAVSVRRHVGTSRLRFAYVRGAFVVIIALEQLAGQASTVCTDVVEGASVPVAARCRIGRMDATLDSIARVVGAGVSVVAVDGSPIDAHPLSALRVEGAGIRVVTEETLVVGDE